MAPTWSTPVCEDDGDDAVDVDAAAAVVVVVDVGS